MNPDEASLLHSLASGLLSASERAVLTDWLIEDGRPHEAELVGLEARLRACNEPAVVRCRELAMKVAPAWRRALFREPALGFGANALSDWDASLTDAPWRSLATIELCRAPARSVLITYAQTPILRVGLPAANSFSAELVWEGLVVIGFEDRACLVDPFTEVTTHFQMEGYFGYAYPRAGYLLLASAQRLHRLEPDGRLAWTSQPVGVDGVVLGEITSDGRILGQGEWDPPGGWVPFTLDLASGASRR